MLDYTDDGPSLESEIWLGWSLVEVYQLQMQDISATCSNGSVIAFADLTICQLCTCQPEGMALLHQKHASPVFHNLNLAQSCSDSRASRPTSAPTATNRQP